MQTLATRGTHKTKEELLQEVIELRQRVSDLEAEVLQANSQTCNQVEGSRLDASSEWFQTLFEYAPDAYYLNDLEARFVDGNRAAEEVIGYPREELIGKSFLEVNVLSPDQLPKAAQILSQNAQGQTTGPDEFILTRRDGAPLPVEIRTAPVEINGQSLVLGIARDITERKRMEDQLREAEERYRTLVENANDAILLVQNNKTIYRNRAHIELLGYNEEELAAQPFLECVIPEDRKRILRYQQKRLRGESVPQQYEITIMTRSGQRVPMELKPRIIEYQGQPAVLVLMRNISERKKAEEALHRLNVELEQKVAERTAALSQANAELRAEIAERKRTEEALRVSEEKYRDLVENLNDVIFTTDANGNVTYVNNVIKQLSGYTPDELIGKPFLDFIHPEDLSGLMDGFQKTLAGEITPVECRVFAKDGARHWIRASAHPVTIDGQLVGVRGTAQNITTQKRLELELRGSEERYRSLVEDINDVLFGVDLDGQISYISPVITSLSGYHPDEVIGRSFTEFIYPEDLPALAKSFEHTLAGQLQPSEYRIMTKSGDLCWVRSSSRPIQDDNKTIGLQGLITDITAQKEVESQLRERQQFIEQIADTTPTILYLYDYTQQRNIYVNKQASAILGYEPGVIDEMGSDMAARLLHPDDMTWFALQNKKLKSLNDSAVLETEYRMRHADGSWRWLQSRETVFRRAEDGSVEVALGTAQDITARKQAEQELAEQHSLLQAIVEGTTDVIFAKDRESRHILMNSAGAQILGKDPAEILGKTDEELFLPDSAARFITRDQSTMETGELQAYEETVPDFTDPRTYLVVKAPYRDNEANVIGVVGIARDITERKQIEQDLRLTRFAVGNAAEGVLRFSNQGQILDVNATLCQQHGYTRAALLDMWISDLDPDYQQEVWPAHWQEIKQKQTMVIETRHQKKSGQIFPVEVSISHFEFEGEEFGFAFIRDITERKRIELALRDSEERYRGLIESTHDLIQSVSRDASFLFVNRAWLNALGYTEDELPSLQLFDIIHPESLAHCQDVFAQVLSGTALSNVQATFLTKDGRPLPVEGNITGRYDGTQLVATHGFFRDITERKQAEEALRASEERYRMISQSVSDYAFSFHFTPDGDILTDWYTDSFAKITGYAIEDLLGKVNPWRIYIHPDDIERVLHTIRSMQPNVPESYEFRLYTKSGDLRWIRSYARIVEDTEQHVTRFYGAAQDITERKQAEEALKESEERYRGLIESQQDLVVRIDSHGQFTFVNEAYCRTFNKTLEELLGSSFMPLVHPDDQKATEEAMQQLYIPPYRCTVEQRALTVQGWRWFTWEDYAIRSDSGELAEVQAIGRDITSRKQAEEALRESEARYAGIFRNTADPIFLLNLREDGDFVYEEFNPAQEEVTGLTTPKVKGKTPAECFPPQTAVSVTERYLACFKAGEPMRYEEEVTLPLGIGYRIAQTVLAPIRDASGQIHRLVGIVHDVTAQKQAEKTLQKTNQQLAETLEERKKLSTVLRNVQEHERRHLAQELHDGVAQTLSGVLMHVDLLDSQLEEMPLKYNELVGQIHELLESAINEIRSLAWALRPGALDDLGLADALPGLVTNMTRNVPIKTTLNMSPQLPSLPPGTETAVYRITQEALSNILKHARASAVSIDLRKKKHSVVLTVEDDGQGIHRPQEKAAPGQEPGLGLWSMRERAEEVGGTFVLESAPQDGTKIMVTIPTAPEPTTQGESI